MILIEALVVVDYDRRQGSRTWHLLRGFDESRQFLQTDKAVVISIALKKTNSLKLTTMCIISLLSHLNCLRSSLFAAN